MISSNLENTRVQLNIGLVLNTSDPELGWNAIRLGITSLKKGHVVILFLLASGVEALENDHLIFDISSKIIEFVDQGGKVLACGTCLNIRKQKEMEICPVSTMDDLLDLIETSDRILTFG